jgi:filamentous hemagglutinin family protein
MTRHARHTPQFQVKPICRALARLGAGSLVLSSLSLPTLGRAQAPQLPTGATVSAGSVSISQPSATSQFIHQSSSKAIIDWQSFSIGQGNAVVFNQPSASSIALNRVNGSEVSSILGHLSANGQIFLVNPNGVYFGRGAMVDTAGIVASTLNISNEDFLAGRYVFSRDPRSPLGAEVRNEGRISALDGGYAVLAGDRVTNTLEGLVSARLGSVVLASGDRMTLDVRGDSLIRFSVDAPTQDRLPSVSNAGELAAAGGKVIMSAMAARDLAGTVVNNTGLIRATGVEERDGAIVLTGSGGDVRTAGILDASGARGGSVRVQAEAGTAEVSGSVSARGSESVGGSIEILGQRVGVFGGVIDASGETGGGSVLVGGDYRGQNAGVQNAQATYVAREATLRADAGASGDGGKLIVWSDGSTRSHGALSARGGAASGNGGLIETSGHDLDVRGDRIDASAPNGAAGTWLIDPLNITIATAASAGGAFDSGSPNDVWTPSATGSTVINTDINSRLNAGTNVTITTTNAAAEAGNITVAAPILLSSATARNATLSLQADGSIAVNDSISASGAGNVLNVNLNAAAGSVSFGASGSVHTGTNGSLSVSTGGTNAITQTTGSSLVVGGTTTLAAGAPGTPGSITLTNAGNDFGSVAITRSSAAALRDVSALVLGLSSVSGTLDITAEGVSQSAHVEAGSLLLQGTGTFNLNNVANKVGTLAASITGPLTYIGDTSAGALNIGSVNGVNGITTANGNVAVQVDELDVAQNISAGSGTVRLLPLTTTRQIDIGTKSASSLSFTAAELARVQTTASFGFTLGANDHLGKITVTQPTTTTLATGGLTLATHAAGGIEIQNSLTSGTGNSAIKLFADTGSVVETGAGRLTGSDLAVNASNAVTLNGANQLANLGSSEAVILTGPGDISINNARSAGMSVTTVDNQDTGSIAITNTGAVTVNGAASAIRTSNGNVTLTSSAGAVSTGSINSSGVITISAAGAVTASGNVGSTSGASRVSIQTGAGITQTAGQIKAGALELTGAGNVALTRVGTLPPAGTITTTTYNDVDTLAANITGSLSYTGQDALTIGTAGATSGIRTNNNDVSITTGGVLTTNSVNGNTTLSPASGTLTLTNDLNAGTGIVRLTVNNGAGINQTGGALTAGTLIAAAPDAGTINLNQAGNHAGNVALRGFSGVTYRDSGNFNVISPGAGAAGLANASNGDITITAGGAISLLSDVRPGNGTVSFNAGTGMNQTAGGIIAPSLLLSGTGPFNLSQATNSVDTLAGSFSGSLIYRDANALTIGTVGGISGVTSTNQSTLDIGTVDGILTVSQPVISASGASRGDVTLTAGGAARDLVLNANVTGNTLRLTSTNNVRGEGPGIDTIDSNTLVIGSKTDPTLQPSATSFLNFIGATSPSEYTLYFDNDTSVDRDLNYTTLIIAGLTAGKTIRMGAGRKITAGNLVFQGLGNFQLDNAGNNVSNVAGWVNRSEWSPGWFWLFGNYYFSSGDGFVRYADVDSVAVSAINTSTFGQVSGLLNGGTGLTTTGVPVQGQISLSSGGLMSLTQGLTANSIALNSTNGVTQTGGAIWTGAAGTSGGLSVTGSGNIGLANTGNLISNLSVNTNNAASVQVRSGVDMDLSGATAIGTGPVTVDIGTSGALNVTGPVTVRSSVANLGDADAPLNDFPAVLRLTGGTGVSLSANVTVTGGSLGTGDAALASIVSNGGGVWQNAATTISVTDNGHSTVAGASPHRARVEVIANKNVFDSESAAGGCALTWWGGGGCAGGVTLGTVNVNSARGAAWISVDAPAGIAVNGALTAQGQTTPRVKLNTHVGFTNPDGSNGRRYTNRDGYTGGDIAINAAITSSVINGGPVNSAGTESGGIGLSGRSVLANARLVQSGPYSISSNTWLGALFNADICTTVGCDTANDQSGGVGLSTETNSLVSTGGASRIYTKQLTITGEKGVGDYDLKTKMQVMQALGTRNLTIDNGAWTGTLVVPILGQVNTSTNPTVDKPVNNVSLTTGGSLTLLTLNNCDTANCSSSAPVGLNLVANSITVLPHTLNTRSSSNINLRPFNANNAIYVQGTGSGASGTTYSAAPLGLLNQFHPEANLTIGGPSHQGDIYIGANSADVFSLGRMDLTFQTQGRVRNRLSFSAGGEDAPISTSGCSTWSLLCPPEPFTALEPGIARITGNPGGTAPTIRIVDSLVVNGNARNAVIDGRGTGTGGTTGAGGGTGSSGGGGGGGGGGSSSAGGSGTSPAGNPGGGGDSGAPGDTATTDATGTGATGDSKPKVSAPGSPTSGSDPSGGAGGGGSLAGGDSGDSGLADGTPDGTDGGSQFAGDETNTDAGGGSQLAGDPGGTNGGTGGDLSGTADGSDSQGGSSLSGDSSGSTGDGSQLAGDGTGSGSGSGSGGAGLSGDGSGSNGGGSTLADGSAGNGDAGSGGANSNAGAGGAAGDGSGTQLAGEGSGSSGSGGGSLSGDGSGGDAGGSALADGSSGNGGAGSGGADANAGAGGAAGDGSGTQLAGEGSGSSASGGGALSGDGTGSGADGSGTLADVSGTGGAAGAGGDASAGDDPAGGDGAGLGGGGTGASASGSELADGSSAGTDGGTNVGTNGGTDAGIGAATTAGTNDGADGGGSGSALAGAADASAGDGSAGLGGDGSSGASGAGSLAGADSGSPAGAGDGLAGGAGTDGAGDGGFAEGSDAVGGGLVAGGGASDGGSAGSGLSGAGDGTSGAGGAPDGVGVANGAQTGDGAGNNGSTFAGDDAGEGSPAQALSGGADNGGAVGSGLASGDLRDGGESGQGLAGGAEGGSGQGDSGLAATDAPGATAPSRLASDAGEAGSGSSGLAGSAAEATADANGSGASGTDADASSKGAQGSTASRTGLDDASDFSEAESALTGLVGGGQSDGVASAQSEPASAPLQLASGAPVIGADCRADMASAQPDKASQGDGLIALRAGGVRLPQDRGACASVRSAERR